MITLQNSTLIPISILLQVGTSSSSTIIVGYVAQYTYTHHANFWHASWWWVDKKRLYFEIVNLGSALLRTTNDDLPFYLYHVIECTLWIDFFGSSPNVKLATYVIVKSLQNKLSNCCITFAYEYSKCFTFILLISNLIMSFGNFFIIGIFESYIVQCKSSVNVCIWTKIQWLLFMKICWWQLVRYLYIILMIAYMCVVQCFL
jgi:hypothetical protein